MGKKIIYQEGGLVGDFGIEFIQEIKPHTPPCGSRKRMGLFKCHCGKEFETAIARVRSGHTKSCGCNRYGHHVTHGLTSHPLYKKWCRIKARCYNENTREYKWYGGSGITMCDEWINDASVFIDYILGLPNAMGPGLTIDRKHNDKNYEPGNLRWTDQHNQMANQRLKSTNTSGFKGVYPKHESGKWVATLSNNHIGTYETIKEAVKSRNQYIIDNELFEYQIQQI